MSNTPTPPASERTEIKRVAVRGNYEREQLYSILDACYVCHLAFVQDGQPFSIPMLHWRIDDGLYLHGSPGSRSYRHLKSGAPIAVSVALVDGLVLARSAFHHSINYRSAVVLGQAQAIETPEEKSRALDTLVETVLVGRGSECRAPSEQELKMTGVLRISLSEASSKLRSGPPVDEEEDYDLPIWAGVLPIETKIGAPVPDPRMNAAQSLPDSLRTPKLRIK